MGHVDRKNPFAIDRLLTLHYQQQVFGVIAALAEGDAVVCLVVLQPVVTIYGLEVWILDRVRITKSMRHI